MRSTLRCALPVAWFITLVHTTPLPFPQAKSADEICLMSAERPDTWGLSGANKFLEDFITKEGPKDWANKIDQITTRHGSTADSNLNCVALLTGDCRTPNLDCHVFTPPELWHIRNVMSTTYRLLKGYRTAISDAVQAESLSIGQLVSDFGKPQSGFNLISFLSASFAIGGGIAAFGSGAGLAVASAGQTVLSGILGAAASAGSPSDNTQNELNLRLRDTLTSSLDRADFLARLIFGGEQDTSQLNVLVPPFPGAAETTDIGKFFAGGRFLIPATTNLDLEVQATIKQGMKQLRHALIFHILKNKNFLLWIDEGTTAEDKCNFQGSAFMDNLCYRIISFDKGYGTINELPKNLGEKFDGYGLDKEALKNLFRNAETCYNATPGGGGDVQTGVLPFDGSLPQCFVNMPVVKGRDCENCGDGGCYSEIKSTC